ncbi:MAG: acetyltransferase [Lachnospiraceae bacterium]|jgi:RimJ/RimL family protein N-acetyltransferase|nr:acetyltransferase [Lachnospiraceae bacterium]
MLTLRALEDSDVPLVSEWLNKEHVKRWYELPHMGVGIDDWLAEINARDGDFKWITYQIVLWQGKPIGFCQFYRCEDSIDEDFGTMPIEGAYGIDYLIGESDYLGRGLGKQMIGLLMETIGSFPDAKRITADIDQDNRASARSLLSCGFVLLDDEGSRYVWEDKSKQVI